MSDAKKRLLTADRLRELLSYDPETGIFSWLVNSSNTKIGEKAGSNHRQGYLEVGIDGRSYLCHRLAWLHVHVHGRWPVDKIDHINGIRTDNRIANLRECNHQLNCQNVRAHRDGSGLVGTSFDKKARRWQAGIGINRKRIFLGYFDSQQEAHEAYLRAKLEYHPFGAKGA